MDEQRPQFGSDEGMQPNANAAQQLTQPQTCMRCGKHLHPPYARERFVYGTEQRGQQPERIDLYGFACVECQQLAPDYDWYEEED